MTPQAKWNEHTAQNENGYAASPLGNEEPRRSAAESVSSRLREWGDGLSLLVSGMLGMKGGNEMSRSF